MAMKWEKSDSTISQRVAVSQIDGFLGKKIQLSETENAVLEKEGEPVRSFSEGKHKVSGMFSGSEMNVVFVDTSPKSIHQDIKGLWTGDDKEINAAIEMKFSVTDAEKVRKLLMGRRNILSVEDVWTELRKEIVVSSMAPIVKKKVVDELQDEKKVEKEIRIAVEVEARKKFEVFGLRLLSFSVEFILPKDYKEYLKRRGEIKEDVEKSRIDEEEDTRKTVHDREMAEISGTVETREGALDEMQRERIKREAEMQIEEEETQQDMKDALEGLKLKDVKEKQKMAEEVERKNLGLESLKEVVPDESGGTLEERYDGLQKMIGSAEKKYLQRKIDKETLRKMVEEAEKEKTELEVKMEKKKK